MFVNNSSFCLPAGVKVTYFHVPVQGCMAALAPSRTMNLPSRFCGLSIPFYTIHDPYRGLQFTQQAIRIAVCTAPHLLCSAFQLIIFSQHNYTVSAIPFASLSLSRFPLLQKSATIRLLAISHRKYYSSFDNSDFL